MKKLFVFSFIGTCILSSSNLVKSDELIQHANHGGNTSIMGIQSVNSSTGEATTLATFDNGETIFYPQGIYFTNEFQGKYYVKAMDSKGDFWFEYDYKTKTITKKTNYPDALGMSQFPYGIKSIVSRGDDGSIHVGENSAVFKEENGREKFWAQDANGKSIPIDITNGSKLLINGRNVEQSINNVGALSAALTGLPTVPKDTTIACGLGTGTHGGDFAFSGGCASQVNEKLSINYAASITMPGQEYAGDFEDQFSARAGFVWKLGKTTKPTQISMKETKELKKEISDLKENNKNIIAQNNALLARLERLEKVALGDLKSKDLAVYPLK